MRHDRPRTIIHLDLDAFFCAVEEGRDPGLRGKPFAVGGRPEGRGVVCSCSYAARSFGVRSAMPMARALTLCPDLVIVPPYFPAYRGASRGVMDRLRALTPLVEQLSIDEAFLDVSELGRPGERLAKELQGSIHGDLGLPCSLGVATNKLVAKIATDVGKAAAQTSGYPNAIQVVSPGEEAAFLAPLPVRELWGVGPKTEERLTTLGLRTIGDLAHFPEEALVRRFGKHGAELSRHARGIDERVVVTERAAKAISRETTFARDERDGAGLRDTLRSQAADVGRQLRREGLYATTVRIKLRWSDFTTLTRQTTLRQPTDLDTVILSTASRLFEAAWQPGRPVRLLGVGVSGLDTPPRQLKLWDARPAIDSARSQRLDAVVAVLCERFGEGVVRRESTVG